ncbi:MAG: pantoate--beta-alanine ligase [Stellaceae bacterium]
MATALPTVRSVAQLRRRVTAWRGEGCRIALVPTMGALHAGHLALVARARRAADRVVVSLFVNPTQFGPNEDLARYPRDEAGDKAKLLAAGVDLVYAPAVDEIYPAGFATRVTVSGLADRLEGAHRPDHFTGVATVVAKLLIECGADAACFGEKDYQQLQLIRRMASDLDIPTRIIGVATVREADGLALSSRNLYLSATERAAVPALYRTLIETGRRVAGGMAIGDAVRRGTRELRAAGFRTVDYLSVADATTLAPLDLLDRPARILAAASIGRTRLIDNVPLRPISRARAAGSGRARTGTPRRTGSSH